MKNYNEVYGGAAYIIASASPVKFTGAFTAEYATIAGTFKIGTDTITLGATTAFAANDILKNTRSGEVMIVTAVDTAGANDIITVKRGFSYTADPATDFDIKTTDDLTKVGTFDLYDKTKNAFVDTIETVDITKESEQSVYTTNYRGEVKVVNSLSKYKVKATLPTNFLANQLSDIWKDVKVIDDTANAVAHYGADVGLNVTPIALFIIPVEATDTKRMFIAYTAVHDNKLSYAYSKDQAKVPIEFSVMANDIFSNFTLSYGALPVPVIE